MNSGFIPPDDVAAAARRGLELREKFRRGGTSVGFSRARQLANRDPLRARDVVAMSGYFACHEVDKGSTSHRWGDEANPSAGYIAWLLWGGDPGRHWADDIKSRLKKTAAQPNVVGPAAP